MEVRVEIDGGVALVTLCAPERRNALTSSMAAELVEQLEQVDANSSVAATVLTGEGRSFCAGADVAALDEAGPAPLDDAHYSAMSAVYESFRRFGRMRTPTIAAVNGAAVGAGLNLALAADLRVVSANARLLSGFLRIGLHPGGGHFHLLDRFVGRDVMSAMAIFGEEVSGEQAVTLGLAWRSVPTGEVVPVSLELARRVAKSPELARSAAQTMRLETEGARMSWEAGIQTERSPQLRSLWLRDA